MPSIQTPDAGPKSSPGGALRAIKILVLIMGLLILGGLGLVGYGFYLKLTAAPTVPTEPGAGPPSPPAVGSSSHPPEPTPGPISPPSARPAIGGGADGAAPGQIAGSWGGLATPPGAAPSLAPTSPTSPSAPALEGGFDLLSLGEPAGTTLTAVTLADDRLALAVDGGGHGPRVVVVDLATGRVVGRVWVERPAGTSARPPAPPPSTGTPPARPPRDTTGSAPGSLGVPGGLVPSPAPTNPAPGQADPVTGAPARL